MEMILISDPEVLEGEHELIRECLERGLQNLHLRKYHATEREILDLIKRIPESYHPRIVLHHHHYLVRSFNFKGVHFNSFTKEIGDFPKGDLLFSRAVHDPRALEEVEEEVDRVLLSPIFQPISKESGNSCIPKAVLEEEVKGQKHPFELFALGGVSPEKVYEAGELGFDGVAALGSLWEPFKKEGTEKAVERFDAFQKVLSQWTQNV